MPRRSDTKKIQSVEEKYGRNGARGIPKPGEPVT
jgi:hypothetical protein